MAALLYLVPTPIGNLSDISDRCRQTLAEADFIAAEDTRVTRKLLNHLQLHKPLVSYHEHNKGAAGPEIIARIAQGQTCALVTDAGSPAISDPGEDLVRLAAQAQIPVCAIPGPCAAITALSISALPTRLFSFEGFLPAQKKQRQARLDQLRTEPRTMIFYEAPHRLLATLGQLLACFGPDRPISLCRELTKLHEEVLRFDLSSALAYFQGNAPRGEFVLVVGGAPETRQDAPDLATGATLVRQLMASGLSRKEAARQAAAQTGLAKNQLYAASMEAAD